MPAVSLKGVSKQYRIYPSQRDRLVEAASFGKIKRGHDFWALKNINLEVERGTTLGVLGRNGAGKSTLLQVVSGVLQPTTGSVQVNGRPVLLQIGAGINTEYTGRENVVLNGLILGIEHKKIMEKFDEIEAFADLGEFMDQPVKTYSSGMRARLGFAIAINVEPDVLIVDETLSVGDAVFKHMGLQKMRELRDTGTTILFVSHSPGMVKNFCTEAALIHKGELLGHGDTAEITDRYQALLSSVEAEKAGSKTSGIRTYDIGELDEEAEETELEDSASSNGRTPSLRHGTGEAKVSSVEVLDELGQPIQATEFDSTVTVRVHLEYFEDVEGSIVSIVLRNKGGLDVFSTNTNREKVKIGEKRVGDKITTDFTFPVPLKHGSYSVSAAVSHLRSKKVYMDWVDVAAVFKVERPQGSGIVKGLFHVPTEVLVHGPERKRQSKSA